MAEHDHPHPERADRRGHPCDEVTRHQEMGQQDKRPGGGEFLAMLDGKRANSFEELVLRTESGPRALEQHRLRELGRNQRRTEPHLAQNRPKPVRLADPRIRRHAAFELEQQRAQLLKLKEAEAIKVVAHGNEVSPTRPAASTT